MTNDPVYFLLVDDLEENLLALEALLRRDGLVLLKSRSGTDALEQLLRHEVALALIDVQMPNMDGFELAEFMRGTERTRRVPIIFLTAGTADRGRRFRGYEAGAVDFLHKPLEPDILRGKADVFFELYRQRQEVARQRDELRVAMDENARLLKETQQYARALEEADQRKDEFLATLAHELRNPLAPIRTSVEVMRMRGLDDPQLQWARDVIERQTRQLTLLVDDLLDVSRITRGKIELKKEVLPVAEIVRRAVETARPLVAERQHELTVSVPPEPIRVEVDPVRLEQVLANLLNNAAKYTEPQGHIALIVEPGNAEVVLRVRDDGVGIDSELLPRVFDLFVQAESGKERANGGLGIGLSLVQRLVEMHGGSVHAHSDGPGKGSEFVVRLPTARSHAGDDPAPPPPVDPPPQTAGRRILVVDDNVDAAESLAMLLRLGGHRVRVVHDGEAALRTADTQAPELVFLDIGLPGMDGYEVARRLRQLAPTANSVLVALTGWGQAEDRRRSKEAGFNLHMVKPVDIALLDELLTGQPGESQ